MGRLRSLVQDLRFVIWLTVVLPTGLIFLAGTWVARQAFVSEVEHLSAIPGLTAQEIMQRALNSRLVYLTVAISLGWATVQALFVLAIGMNRFRAISKATLQMSQGNYGARVPIVRFGSATLEELTRSINSLGESLERTDRLRRDLVANLAHEIRTPLTNLQGYLEALRDGVIEPSQPALDSIHEEVIRLVRLVDALHQLARADALRQQTMFLAPTHLDALAEQLLRVARPKAEQKSIVVTTDWGARGVYLPVHADSIAQVIRNLFRNAVQYTDSGGNIRIQTRSFGEIYTFACLNTGAGIPAEDLPFIFQRFYRTEKAKQSTSGGVGLGLAICKEIVEAHGGRIGAQSKSGWTSIWFELPLEEGVRLP